MQNKQMKMKFVFAILILFLVLLCMLMAVTLVKVNEEPTEVVDVEISSFEPQNVQEAVEKHNAVFIKSDGLTIFLKFPVDLYNENKTDNEDYFNNIIDEIKPFFEEASFRLVDTERKITIFVKYSYETEEYTIIINDVENFFDKVNSEAYVDVENSKIADETNFAITNNILQTLMLYDNQFTSIKKYLDDGIELENGYISYNNGQLKIRNVPTGGVKNIIFTDEYEGDITYKINTEMTLEEIAEAEKNYVFGSVDKGYLGYRHADFYIFFYEDEVSVYTYSYKENRVFETYLKEYVEKGDLDNFIGNLSIDWIAYDSFKFDSDIQKAKILYSTRGVDIDIEENDPKGITLYSNYYFTKLTREYVKQGIISFEADVDLVEKVEIERRKNS